ncbi:TRAP transporter small permease [Lentibacillus lipolyticus]|nr:TRAP transporter small permease [Lentibacillus lipolyticus]
MVRKFNKFEEIFLITSLALMVALIFGQVVGRYVFESAPSWTEEAARYIHVLQVWVGAGYAVKLREHIKIESFINIIHGPIRKILDMFAVLIWFSLALFLALFGTILVWDSIRYGQVSPAVQIPIWVPYLAIPLGGLSMTIRLIQQLIEIYKTDYSKENSGGESK